MMRRELRAGQAGLSPDFPQSPHTLLPPHSPVHFVPVSLSFCGKIFNNDSPLRSQKSGKVAVHGGTSNHMPLLDTFEGPRAQALPVHANSLGPGRSRLCWFHKRRTALGCQWPGRHERGHRCHMSVALDTRYPETLSLPAVRVPRPGNQLWVGDSQTSLEE